MPAADAPPPLANDACRHFGPGPTCARGVDLKARRDTRPCLPPSKGLGLVLATPGPLGPCPWRADYTDAERAAWRAYVARIIAPAKE